MGTFFKYALPLAMAAVTLIFPDLTVNFIIAILGVLGAGGGAVASFKEGDILFGLDLCLATVLFGVTIFAHFGL